MKNKIIYWCLIGLVSCLLWPVVIYVGITSGWIG